MVIVLFSNGYKPILLEGLPNSFSLNLDVFNFYCSTLRNRKKPENVLKGIRNKGSSAGHSSHLFLMADIY